jgi:nucleoside-diphosphate-sugar epimerase
MRAWITGASGFIGGHLAELLTAQGRAVRALVRSKLRAGSRDGCGVESMEGPLRVQACLTSACADVDLVFHVAGVVKDFRYRDFLQANKLGVRNAVRACAKRLAPPTVVVVSSLSADGPATTDRPRVEEDPPLPVRGFVHRSELVGN